MFTAAKDEYFLPPQIIYQGKLTAVYQQQNFLMNGTSHTQQIIGLMRKLLYTTYAKSCYLT